MLTEKLKNIRHKILTELEPLFKEFDDLLREAKLNPHLDISKEIDKELLTPECLGLFSLAGIKLEQYSIMLRSNYIAMNDYLYSYRPELIQVFDEKIKEMRKNLEICDCDICSDIKFKENELHYMDLARKLYHDSIKGKK